ncbi:substrate-binding domain-containing protein [Sneathiella chungangensis]|uniref:Substrate-binding domain-containing protein n=1 Tax=Sneathiella chungangensis TaxID=1418234 RepID=A0A845MI73_9PROT|nr:LacI family DNA-binding transcriptional regulator [Sneathiella chungangensis]MZR22987.1 substrate-binding domain-containing protein [Sneathiella chungangensis]
MIKQDRDIILKPTVNDIARVAGVSLATVDRVLNGRPGVRGVTIERVNKAIQQLGYVRDTAAANLARGRVYRFHFLLPESNNEFISLLEEQISHLSEVMALDRTRLSFEKVPAFDPQAMARIISEIDPEDVNGIAIFSPETPSVRDAVDQIKKRGVSVVALVSDLPSSKRDHFVGIDNVAAGRTAGQLMGHFLSKEKGKILVVTGSMLARDHLERRLGFDQVMTESFPGITVLPSLEGRDDPDLLERLLPDAFATEPDITGIYSSAAGNLGLIKFLRKGGLDQKMVVVGHELTPLSRDALEQGTFDAIISQDTGHLIRSTVRILRAKTDNLPINISQERIRIDVYLKENMPLLGG